jgi:hypothetical protein
MRLEDVTAGIEQQAHGSPPLRRRSLLDQVRRDLSTEPITTRQRP